MQAENPNRHSSTEQELESAKPIEHDYEAHKEHPAPSEEAVKEENDKGAGPAMKWIIPAILAVLFILWLVMR